MNIPPSMFAAISPLYPTSNKNIKLTAIKCKNISFTALTWIYKLLIFLLISINKKNILFKRHFCINKKQKNINYFNKKEPQRTKQHKKVAYIIKNGSTLKFKAWQIQNNFLNSKHCPNLFHLVLTIKFQSQHFYEHQNKIEILRKNKNENKQNSKANIN